MTAKTSDGPVTGQRRAGARRAVDVAYGYLAAFFVAGVLVQVYLAGIGIFGNNSATVADATSLDPHRAWGTVLMVLSVILLILAALGTSRQLRLPAGGSGTDARTRDASAAAAALCKGHWPGRVSWAETPSWSHHLVGHLNRRTGGWRQRVPNGSCHLAWLGRARRDELDPGGGRVPSRLFRGPAESPHGHPGRPSCGLLTRNTSGRAANWLTDRFDDIGRT